MNMFKIKKWIALLLAGVFPMAASLYILFTTQDVFMCMLAGFVVSIVMILIGTQLFKHPVLAVIEGEGILGITMDSTGVLVPFLLRVQTPYLTGNIDGEDVRTTFDREAVHYLTNPSKGTIRQEGDTVIIEMEAGQYKNNLFTLGGIPTIFYNKHMGAFMPKEMLSTMETTAFVQHLVLHLNRRTDELSSNVRDFARYIVEQTRPQKPIWTQGWFMGLIIIAAIIIFIVLFGPAIFGQASGLIENGGSVITATG